MARGRVIDKEIFSHEILGTLSIETRYFHQALIVLADDEGRLKGSSLYLKGKIFPFDSMKLSVIEKMVDQLATNGFLLVYQVGDDRFLAHPKWDRWQTIRKDRFKPSDCPSPVDGIPVVNQRYTAGSPVLDLTRPDLTRPKDAQPTPSFKKPTPQEVAEYAKSISYDLDASYFVDYQDARGWKLKGGQLIKDWKAVIRTWKKRPLGETVVKKHEVVL